MKFFAIAALVATVQNVKLSEPWDADSLPACPSGERTIMDDGKTHVAKYPYVGATCVLQLNQEDSLIMLAKEVPHDYGDEAAIAAQHKYTMDWANERFTEQQAGVNGQAASDAWRGKGAKIAWESA